MTAAQWSYSGNVAMIQSNPQATLKFHHCPQNTSFVTFSQPRVTHPVCHVFNLGQLPYFPCQWLMWRAKPGSGLSRPPGSAHLAGTPQWCSVPFSGTGGTWCWFVPILVMLTLTLQQKDSEVPPWSQPPGVQAPCAVPWVWAGPVTCFQSREQSRGDGMFVTTSTWLCYVSCSSQPAGASSPLLAVRGQVATWGNPHAKKYRQPLRAADGQHNNGAASPKPQRTECSQQAHEQEADLPQSSLQRTLPWLAPGLKPHPTLSRGPSKAMPRLSHRN